MKSIFVRVYKEEVGLVNRGRKSRRVHAYESRKRAEAYCKYNEEVVEYIKNE